MPLSGPPLDNPRPTDRLLEQGLGGDPGGVAVVSMTKRRTWAELDAASRRLATGFLGLGLRPGDRIASLMPNRCDLLVHYVACMRAGLVSVPLNYRYQPPEIDHALAVSGASALVAHAERDADLAASDLAGRLPVGVIRYRDDGGSEFADLLDATGPVAALPAPSPTAPAFVYFTSGSTGPAKGVTHTFGSLAWMFAATAAGFGLTPADAALPASSLSHLGGFLLSFGSLSVGARVVVPRRTVPDEVLPLLRRERPTVMVMLPAALFGVVRDPHATRDDFRSLRLCCSGGDKVPLELEQEFAELTGVAVDECYGCTEAGHMIMTPPGERIKPGSLGRPLAGYTVSVRTEAGEEVPPGVEGRLWVKGRCLMAGYWDDPAATAAVLRDGWLDTGDVMRADEDGYLWFCGRKKQIIVHDGSNICPQEVEDALLGHPAVAGAGVVGVRDLVHGENVRAYITLRPGVPRPTAQELIRFAQARVGYKAPEEILVLAELPLNPTGKLDRVALKRMAEAPPGGRRG